MEISSRARCLPRIRLYLSQFLTIIRTAVLFILVPGQSIRNSGWQCVRWILLRLFVLTAILTIGFERVLPLFGKNILPPRRERPSLLPTGLSLVDTAPTSIPYSMDVVFVHGLGAFPDSTWRKTKNPADIQWVRDLLPKDVEMARLLFFNYDSTTYNDAPQKQLEDYASDLLLAFHRSILREHRTEKIRPLLFVCHSYGGLVIKEALVQALQDTGQNADILDNVKGIIFLGTPHFGTQYSSYARQFALLLDRLGSNPDIFLPLTVNSTRLIVLHDRFMEYFRDLIMINFFETHKQVIYSFPVTGLPYKVMLVEKNSATFNGPNTINDNMDTDHSGLNKFDSSKDPNYVKIVIYLNSIARKISRLNRAKQEQEYKAALLQSGKPPSISCRSKSRYIVRPMSDPNFVDRPKLMAQLKMALGEPGKSDPPRSVALWGIVASGKSELALKYTTLYRGYYDPIIWIDARTMDTAIESFKTAFQVLDLDFPTHVMDDSRKAGQKNDSKLYLIRNNWIITTVLDWLAARGQEHCQWLIVLDNLGADTIHLFEQIRPHGSRGSLIITSIDQAVKSVVNHDIHVDMMEPHEATELLIYTATAYLPELQRMDAISRLKMRQDKEVLAIVDRLDYYAIAVNNAGAYIGQNIFIRENLTLYLDYFDEASFDLNHGWFSALHPQNLTTVWEASYASLIHSNPQAADLLTLFAVLDGASIEDRLFLEGGRYLMERAARFKLASYIFILLLLLIIYGTPMVLCKIQHRYLSTPQISRRGRRWLQVLFFILPMLLGSMAITVIIFIRNDQVSTGEVVNRRSTIFSAADCIVLGLCSVLVHVPCVSEKILGNNSRRFLKLLPILYTVTVAVLWIGVQILTSQNKVLDNSIKALLLRLDFSQATLRELKQLVSGIQSYKPSATGFGLLRDIAWFFLWSTIVQIIITIMAGVLCLVWDACFRILFRIRGWTWTAKTWERRWRWAVWFEKSETAKFLLCVVIGFVIGLSGILQWNPFRVMKNDFQITTFQLSTVLGASENDEWNRLGFADLLNHITRFSLVRRNADQSDSMHSLVQWWVLQRLPISHRMAWVKLAERLMWYAYDSSTCWDDYLCQRMLIPHLLRIGSLDALLADGDYWRLKVILDRLYRSTKLVQDRENRMLLE